MALRLLRIANPSRLLCTVRGMSSDSQQPGWGSGSGKGGGAGGSVRSAGGAFGEMEAAREEQYFRKVAVFKESGGAFGKKGAYQEEEYFRKKQAEQLANLRELKKHLSDEIHYHQKEIKEHEDDIKRHKEKLEHLKKLDDE